jgi:1,4-dihydroxy-2-naphthoate polyprenyltransferase
MHPLAEAARPRTLPAAVAPVLVGTAAAARPVGELAWGRALLALLVALALQVAVNYANDLFDGLRGVDTEARTGPRRAVASGLVTPAVMRDAMLGALAVAAAAGLALAWTVGWELLLVGVLAILAALGYSGGPRPYASAGLGEVAVFVFFGLVATVGSAYVQDEAVTGVAVLAGAAMGAFATALLVVNNLRDIPTDRAAGKVTLAVRLGEGRTRALYLVLVAGAYLLLVPLVVLTSEGWLALAALSVPLAWQGVERVRHAPLGPQLVAALGHTAQAQLAYAILLALGFVLAGERGA